MAWTKSLPLPASVSHSTQQRQSTSRPVYESPTLCSRPPLSYSPGACPNSPNSPSARLPSAPLFSSLREPCSQQIASHAIKAFKNLLYRTLVSRLRPFFWRVAQCFESQCRFCACERLAHVWLDFSNASILSLFIICPPLYWFDSYLPAWIPQCLYLHL